MLAPNKNPAALANKITELAVRLNVSEEQIRLLREENARLKQIEHAHEQLKSEHQQTVERKVLLEEEVRWLKAQYYGRSTQATDAAEQSPDQAMLFNEAEVLAAIEAADEAHRERTTQIEAHERKRSADAHRKAIPDHFPRIEIEHDLAPDQKLCTRCAVAHPLTRMGQEIRECYRFEPPKISVEQHIRPTYVCEELHEAPITAPAPPVILPKKCLRSQCRGCTSILPQSAVEVFAAVAAQDHARWPLRQSHLAIRYLRREDPKWKYVQVRCSQYLNNLIEQDHRAIKRRCASMGGFKSFSSAAITLAGIELAHRIRKRQFALGRGRYRNFGSLKQLWERALA